MSHEPLRFLADESCDFGVIRTLREHGYDVLAVSEFMQRSEDAQLIALAALERRILLTEDRDFGWLVFVSRADSAGVILLRFPGNARRTLAGVVLNTVREHGGRLLESFVVIQPGHVRISRKA